MKLWKFNSITGFWRVERVCNDDTAQQWLTIFCNDEPQAHFMLSRNAPRFNPNEKAKR